MKVSILTIYNVSNYGTALQAYATQRLIEKNGYDAEIVKYISPQRTVARCLFWTPFTFRQKPLHALVYIIIRLPNNINKRVVFHKFYKKWLHLSKRKYVTINDLRANPPKANVYLTGSDQVWNSDYNEGIDYSFFLDFGSKRTRRCAFAASIGMDRIPDNEAPVFRNLLSQYSTITVRERQAVDELHRIGISSSLVLDPTLLIEGNEWLSMSDKSVQSKDYILVMILYGEDGIVPELASYISEKTGKEIIELVWNPLKRRPWKTIYGKKPETFITYVNQASFVITNSFHVTAFSINLEKQFIAVKRENYNTRISSLLEELRIQDRYVGNDDDWAVYEKKIDYSEVNRRLSKLKQESQNKLSKMLGEMR